MGSRGSGGLAFANRSTRNICLGWCCCVGCLLLPACLPPPPLPPPGGFLWLSRWAYMGNSKEGGQGRGESWTQTDKQLGQREGGALVGGFLRTRGWLLGKGQDGTSRTVDAAICTKPKRRQLKTGTHREVAGDTVAQIYFDFPPIKAEIKTVAPGESKGSVEKLSRFVPNEIIPHPSRFLFVCNLI